MKVFLNILSEEARTSGMKATVHEGKHTTRHNKINSTRNYINLDRKNEQESVKMPLLCNYKPLFFSCTLLGLLASFAHTTGASMGKRKRFLHAEIMAHL